MTREVKDNDNVWWDALTASCFSFYSTLPLSLSSLPIVIHAHSFSQGSCSMVTSVRTLGLYGNVTKSNQIIYFLYMGSQDGDFMAFSYHSPCSGPGNSNCQNDLWSFRQAKSVWRTSLWPRGGMHSLREGIFYYYFLNNESTSNWKEQLGAFLNSLWNVSE